MINAIIMNYKLFLLLITISISACNRMEERNNRTAVNGTVIDQESLDSGLSIPFYIISNDRYNSISPYPFISLAKITGKFCKATSWIN